MTANFSNKNVQVVAFANEVDLSAVRAKFTASYIVQRYKDALHIDMPKGQFFVFDYGVIVAWGVNPAKQAQYLGDIQKIATGNHALHTDNYEFTRNAGIALESTLDDQQATPSERINIMLDDKIFLPTYDVFVLLSISHALAQSAKLQLFEARAQTSIENNQYITNTLASTGKIPLNRRELARLRGQLFQTKSDIVLHYNLLDTPEFFWDNPAVERYYQAMAKYLELTQRVELLNIKLHTIQDLFDMLASEQNHKHSSFLEWIIIILIAVEIVLFFWH